MNTGVHGVADIHDDRALADCLVFMSDRLTHVVILGDLFDAYVEYRHLVPRGPSRTLGVLARLADRGVEVSYVVGNHDPWHRTYVELDLGFQLVRDQLRLQLFGLDIVLEHGDRAEHRHHSLGRLIVRHRLALWLYTTVLPGDFGQGLALRMSSAVRGDTTDSPAHQPLRAWARSEIERSGADVVAMAHSHRAVLEKVGGGIYVNPGFWPKDRTVVTIEATAITLQEWTGVDLAPVDRQEIRHVETPGSTASLPPQR